MTDSVARERAVQSKLRMLALGVGTAAWLALLLSFVDIEKWSWDDKLTVEDAWDWAHRGWLIAVVLPCAWVAKHPRRRPVLGWAAWFVGISVAFELYVRLQKQAEWSSTYPIWVSITLATLVITMGITVMFVMPILRIKSPEPPPLPEARVHDPS